MRKALLVVLILSSALSRAQGGCTGQKPLDGVTTGGFLKALSNQAIRVCSDTANPCTLAQIYSDAALTHVLANPVTTDVAGNYQYCAATGAYNEQITSSSGVFAQVNNTPVTIGGGDVTQSGNNNLTGTNTIATLNGTTLRGQSWTAFGDSKTVGFGASVPANSWVSLVAAARGYTVTNKAVTGDTLIDQSTAAYTYTSGTSPITSLLIGQNDGCVEGSGDATPSTLWQNAYEAVTAYLLTPRKITGQASAATKVGSWVNSDMSSFGVKTTTNGDTITVSTVGPTAYLGFMAVLSNTSNASITVDGVSKGTFTPFIRAADAKGKSSVPYLVRLAQLGPGTHTIVITANIVSAAPLYFDWAAGNSGQDSVFHWAMTPDQTTGLTANFVGYCQSSINAAVGDLAEDGLNVRVIDTATACYDYTVNPPAPLCNFFDGTHPDDGGYARYANKVNASLNSFAWQAKNPQPRIDPANPPAWGGTTPSSGAYSSLTTTLAGTNYQIRDTGGTDRTFAARDGSNNLNIRALSGGGSLFLQDNAGVTYIAIAGNTATFSKSLFGNVTSQFAQFTSTDANVAQSGTFRLGPTQTINFRNNAHSGDIIGYGKNTSDLPTWNTTPIMPVVASLTTTAAASDAVTVTGATTSSHCSVTPTNASAATNLATTFVSAKAANTITVSHTATASMTYDLICTAN